MSQEEVARRVGCSQASLSNYELGKRRLYFAEMVKFCDVLNRPLTYFIEDIEPSEADNNNFRQLLKDPYLNDIFYGARNLKVAQRKSVLEYIQWQQTKTGEKH